MADCVITSQNSNTLNKVSHRRLTVRLLQYLFPYKWSVLGILTLTILDAPLATAGPLLTKAAIDLFLLPNSPVPVSGYVLWLKRTAEFVGLGGSRHHGLIFIAILFLFANIAQSATQYLQVVLTENVGQRAIHDLRQEIFSHLQQVPIQVYDHTPVGQLMTRLTTDVDALNEMFSSGMVTILSHVAIVFYVAAWMVRINWSLALMTCGTLLAMVGFTAWFRIVVISISRRFRERIAAINAFLQEHLTGMQVLQIFSCEPQELRAFERINEDHCQAGMAGTFRNAVFYPAIQAMALIGIALVIWYGGGQVMHGFISLGSLVAFIQLAQSFYDPITEISSKYPVLQAALVSSERIFALLDEPTANVSLEKPLQIEVARGRVEFRNVWFAYKPEDWILKDVSFIVEPGEKVAFVGRTGAGKTTISNLLLRFYEIQRGQILLDNVDIRQINPAELRSNFAIVPQDIDLFPGDITSNISLRNLSISEEMVRTAANAVHLEEFVTKLDQGYHSEVLERGAGLSVGQRQLVGFARALAFDRPILILDEATSSVDSQTESLICDAVRRIMAGRTGLVIAHRLSTVQSADKILVIHKGKIRESGDHKSLLAQRGLYWRFYYLQVMNRSKFAGVKSIPPQGQPISHR